jgi:MFS family permease
MLATGIVAFFSLLSAASSGAHHSLGGMLAMLSACRYAVICESFAQNTHWHYTSFSFLLGIGVGAEYPCGSVAASEQSEESAVAKNAQHRWFALATSGFPLYMHVLLCLIISASRFHD